MTSEVLLSEPSLLDTILEPGGLSVVFQPVFEVHPKGRRLHALECLMRGPKGTNMESPEVLFEYVRRKREESLVDRACVSTALKGASQLPGEPHLSINVHASTLGRDQEFLSLLVRVAEKLSISLSRLTVEIVEHSRFWDGRSFHRALAGLREIGASVALDDIGNGESNYRMILECQPDYFKIDRYFVKGSDKDFYRRAVLESVSGLARSFGARVVAEGVEEVAELDTVAALGIDLIQGYVFSPPLSSSELIESGFLEGRLTLEAPRRS